LKIKLFLAVLLSRQKYILNFTDPPLDVETNVVFGSFFAWAAKSFRAAEKAQIIDGSCPEPALSPPPLTSTLHAATAFYHYRPPLHVTAAPRPTFHRKPPSAMPDHLPG
jgi:hypothetical protein